MIYDTRARPLTENEVCDLMWRKARASHKVPAALLQWSHSPANTPSHKFPLALKAIGVHWDGTYYRKMVPR